MVGILQVELCESALPLGMDLGFWLWPRQSCTSMSAINLEEM